MDLGEIALLVTALGVGGILTRLVDQLLDRRKGRQAAEQSAWEQRDRAMRYRDAEARLRRRLEETLQATRHELNRHGVPYEDMPPWPPTRTRSDIDD